MSEHLVSDGYKLGSERDAMAWQMFLAMLNAGWAKEAIDAYALTDAFLAERKRQQGEA